MKWQYSIDSQINRDSNTFIFGHVQDTTDGDTNSVGMLLDLMQDWILLAKFISYGTGDSSYP